MGSVLIKPRVLAVCWFFLMMPMTTGAEVIRLDQYEVFHVNSTHPIEPSGLTIKEGRLYTVCDDNNTILTINDAGMGEVDAEVFLKLDARQLSAMDLDLEAITTVAGDFFVVSESNHKLIHVKGQQLSWVPDLGGVYASAYQAGLFQIYNAGLEAAAYLGNQTFLLSVERQPRGLIEVTFDADFKTMLAQHNQVFADSNHPLSAERKPDLTGLFYHAEKIYALHRNAYMIHELIKNEAGDYAEGQSWSYEHIVKHPKYVYEDMTFGHAEGLAVDDDNFYLIIDNNNNPKKSNPKDLRPLLIKAKR